MATIVLCAAGAADWSAHSGHQPGDDEAGSATGSSAPPSGDVFFHFDPLRAEARRSAEAVERASVTVKVRQVVKAAYGFLVDSKLLAQRIKGPIRQPGIVQAFDKPIQLSREIASHHLAHLVLPEPCQ